MHMNPVLLLLWIAGSVCQVAPGKVFLEVEDQGYFYAPVSTDITWSPVQPKEIRCFLRPAPEIGFDNRTTITGKKFTHTESKRAHGYLCTKSEWSITCAEGFLGDRSITHTIRPSLPTLSECFSAIRDYKTNHNLEKGYPAEQCGWMGTNTATTTNIHVSETLVEMDPYNLHLLDPRFISGSCIMPPCTLTTMDTLWINSSSPKASCDSFADISLYVRDLKSQDFFSPSLIADRVHAR